MRFSVLLSAFGLVAITVAVHIVGLVFLVKSLFKLHNLFPTHFWSFTWMMIRVVWSLIFVHAIEITVWALFYLWAGCLTDGPSAFYFSGVTYTTVGYGDLLLPGKWRLLAPIEALSGILMCGVSAGLFFAVVNTMLSGKSEFVRS